MKRNVCRIFILLWIGIFFVSLAWADDGAVCASLSHNYEKPYTGSKEWLNCIIWSFTNKTSSKGTEKDLWNFETKDFLEQYCQAML